MWNYIKPRNLRLLIRARQLDESKRPKNMNEKQNLKGEALAVAMPKRSIHYIGIKEWKV